MKKNHKSTLMAGESICRQKKTLGYLLVTFYGLSTLLVSSISLSGQDSLLRTNIVSGLDFLPPG